MEKNEAIEKTLQMLNKSKTTPIKTKKIEIQIEPNYYDNYDWLPPLENNQFLIMIGDIVFCIEEPSWWLAQKIEYESFRKDIEDRYFASEYEKRELIRHCLKWVAELSTQKIIKEDILEHIHPTPIDKLWDSLYSKLKINSIEANDLYKAAKAYYSNSQEFVPIHPIIIELDMMMKFGSLTRQEIRDISMTDMERIKIILMARAEIMKLTNTLDTTNKQTKMREDNIVNQFQKHPTLFPPGVNPLAPSQYLGTS